LIRRLLRWIGIVLGSVVGLGIAAYAVVYVVTERDGRRTYPYPTPSASMLIPTDAASIREGQRLSSIHGCLGCHGEHAEGAVLLDNPLLARIVAPSLTAAVRNYSDSELDAIIRHGVRPGGRIVAVMPSQVYLLLTDEDLGRIIAFLRSLPAAAGLSPSISVGPLARIGMVTGKFKPVPQLIAESVPPPEATGEQATFGRYLARTTCALCHGSALRGDSHVDGVAPTLQVVAAYSPEDFAQLMRTGVAVGGRTLGMMSAWARDNLSHFTDPEIAALYSYLHALPAATAN
jgi:cytochrome c553